MNRRLIRQTLRWQRARLAVVIVAGIGWGALMPVLYSQFSDVIRDMANSGALPEELMNIGSGSLFTLPGTITLGLQHPLAIAMLGIFAVVAATSAFETRTTFVWSVPAVSKSSNTTVKEPSGKCFNCAVPDAVPSTSWNVPEATIPGVCGPITTPAIR
jgi:hypothetical protein